METFISNLEQRFIELFADFLDREDMRIDEAIHKVHRPPLQDETLHLEMARAAMDAYVRISNIKIGDEK